MASLRKGKCYRKQVRPYTRTSKVKAKSFIKTRPANRIVRYNMGNSQKDFKYEVLIVSKEDIQIRHNALESARLVVFRRLQKLGNTNFYFQINVFPHQILRENKMLSGARADRLQTGMSHAFGKPMGLAARVKKGKVILSTKVDSENLEAVKDAMKKSIPRLPCRCSVEIKKIDSS
ncbi:50S ribosomal protein L16 [Candidatus Woesearchaeota archaeon]|nr:50S ribosomal protein L16 [Candidatus Woesearchaeota archaeon]